MISIKRGEIISLLNEHRGLLAKNNCEALEGIETEMENTGVLKEDRILIVSDTLLHISQKLHDLGYKKLYLVSNRKSVYDSPYYTRIKYVYGDLRNLHYPEYFFKVIIVPYSLFSIETLKLLDREGIVIVLFSWAKGHAEKLKLNLQISKECEDFDVKYKQRYILIRAVKPVYNLKKIPNIDILCYSYVDDGILIHSKLLKKRLEEEYDFTARIIHNIEELTSNVVIIEYHRGFGLDEKLLTDVSTIVKKGSKVVLENHSPIGFQLYSKLEIVGGQDLIVTYRSTEIAKKDRASSFKLFPVLNYTQIPLQEPFNDSIIRIGTFGFAGKGKGIDDLIDLCKKLNVPAIMLLGINPLDSNGHSKAVIGKLISKYSKYADINFLEHNVNTNYDLSRLNVIIGTFSDNDIINYMANCSHIAFAHRSRLEESGTMKYAKRLNRPVFALDSFQSRVSQVYRYRRFTRSSPFRILMDSLTESVLDFKRGRSRLGDVAEEFIHSVLDFLGRSFTFNFPTRKTLLSLNDRYIRDEDGLDYLVKILASISKDCVAKYV